MLLLEVVLVDVVVVTIEDILVVVALLVELVENSYGISMVIEPSYLLEVVAVKDVKIIKLVLAMLDDF